MSSGRAHDEALPLVALLRRLECMDEAPEVVTVVAGYLIERQLFADLMPVIAFADGNRKVQLEPVTPFGTALLQEVVCVFGFLPCPEGECEFSGNACRWCGTIRH